VGLAQMVCVHAISGMVNALPMSMMGYHSIGLVDIAVVITLVFATKDFLPAKRGR